LLLDVRVHPFLSIQSVIRYRQIPGCISGNLPKAFFRPKAQCWRLNGTFLVIFKGLSLIAMLLLNCLGRAPSPLTDSFTLTCIGVNLGAFPANLHRS